MEGGLGSLYTFLVSFFTSSFLLLAPTWAKYAITFFVFSVLPAPDSPLGPPSMIQVLKGRVKKGAKKQKENENIDWLVLEDARRVSGLDVG